MKTEKRTLYQLTFACLLLSSITFSQANEVTDTASEDAADIAINAGPDLIPRPELAKHSVGDVNYVSGGIGLGEAAEIKQLAKSYLLEVICVQKVDGADSYLADVKVQIVDAKGNTVLDVATDGPYLLANMPRGSYMVNADYNGVVKHSHVSIGGKHKRLVFTWRG